MENFDILEKLYQETIDMDSVMETVRDTHVRGFKTLYDIQRSLSHIEHFEIPLQDFVVADRLYGESESIFRYFRNVYPISVDIIGGGIQYEKYHQDTSLFEKTITLKTISDRPEIFRYNIIPVLNGTILYSMRVTVSNDGCTLVIPVGKSEDSLPFISYENFMKLYEENPTLYVYTIPNYEMRLASVNKYNISSSGIVNSSSFKNLNSANTLVCIGDGSIGLLNFVVSNITPNNISIPTSIMSSNINTYTIMTLTFDNLYDIIPLSSKSSDWFMLDNRYELPLPVENIIPYYDNGDTFSINSTISIELYYPNIYHITRTSGKAVKLMVFYKDNTIDASYKNELEYLHLKKDSLIDLYRSNSIPSIIRNYRPLNVQLPSEVDFKTTIYYPSELKSYMVEQFDEYIQQKPDMLLKYLYIKLKNTNRYSISVAKLNIVSRRRTSSAIDFSDDEFHIPVTFSETRIVFNLRKKFTIEKRLHFRVFVNGLLLNPEEYTVLNNKDFHLIYIVEKLISSNSYVEIELFENRFKDNIEVGKVESIKTGSDTIINEIKNIDSTIGVQPLKISVDKLLPNTPIYNVYIYDNTSKYILDSEIRFFIYNQIVDKMIEISPTGSVIVDSDLYVVVPNSYIGKTLYCTNDTSLYTVTENSRKDSVAIKYEQNVPKKVRKENIMAFHNGCRLPDKYIKYYLNSLKEDDVRVYVNAYNDNDKNFNTIDILPYGEIKEFSLTNLTDNKGYINTGNSLSLPFDLKWYDVYLNGKKLNKGNIDIISSNKFMIKNVSSTKNLEIYKREDMYGAFSSSYDSDANNILFNTMPEILTAIKNDYSILQDTVIDITAEAITEVFEHISFVEKYLRFSFINPNIQQVTPEMKLEYSDLINEYGVLELDTNKNHGAYYITSINSNIRRENMRNNQNRYGFTPLHVGFHDDALLGEYLCDPLTGSPAIKTEEGDIISSGILSRLASHKAKMIESLAVNNMGSLSIYQLDSTLNTRCVEMIPSNNFLDENVKLDSTTLNPMISFDMDVLVRGEQNVMLPSPYDPLIEIQYYDDTNTFKFTRCRMSLLSDSPINISSQLITISSIAIVNESDIPRGARFIVYSILIAC